jgi:hypothetical protein
VHTDEGFREIQLSGKQLVFLFMAATVVSVVIFLCGVLVGRGVRVERLPASDPVQVAVVPDPSAAVAPQVAVPSAQPSAEPPAPPDEFSYFDRLQKNETPPETVKSSSGETKSPGSPPAQQAVAAAKHPVSDPADAHSPAVPSGEPSGPGIAHPWRVR